MNNTSVNPVEVFPELAQHAGFPEGHTKETLFRYLSSYNLDGLENPELVNYLKEDFMRFVYTWNLLPQRQAGRALEVGSNPYYTSLLVTKFSKYALDCTNYFGDQHPSEASQTMVSKAGNDAVTFQYRNLNVETTAPTFNGEHIYDLALYCEVLEHMTNDPLQAILNIKKCLKPNGCLILSTPNVNRLENVSRMLSGANIYDPYSGYGPYGRHNREYNKHELNLLLKHAGFDIEIMFSSDVHANRANDFFNVNQFAELIRFRKLDLGQYIFIRAVNRFRANPLKPSWLYRSYTPGELTE